MTDEDIEKMITHFMGHLKSGYFEFILMTFYPPKWIGTADNIMAENFLKIYELKKSGKKSEILDRYNSKLKEALIEFGWSEPEEKENN